MNATDYADIIDAIATIFCFGIVAFVILALNQKWRKDRERL
jgi:hypothetical protein